MEKDNRANQQEETDFGRRDGVTSEDPPSSSRLRDRRHRLRQKVLVQPAKPGDHDVRWQATWRMLVEVGISDICGTELSWLEVRRLGIIECREQFGSVIRKRSGYVTNDAESIYFVRL